MKYALIQKIQNLMKQLKVETYHEQGKYNRLGILQDDYDDDASMMVMNPSRKYCQKPYFFMQKSTFNLFCLGDASISKSSSSDSGSSWISFNSDLDPLPLLLLSLWCFSEFLLFVFRLDNSEVSFLVSAFPRSDPPEFWFPQLLPWLPVELPVEFGSP